MIGISKRALMEDYYIDEIEAVIRQWNDIRNPDREEEPEEVDAAAFLGDGGEIVG